MLQLIVEDRTGNGDIHLMVLRAICGNNTHNESLLDLCCGAAPTTRRMLFNSRTFVDVVERSLGDECDPLFIKSDCFAFLEQCQHFNHIILLDAIEHFRFNDGYKLLDMMKSKSDKQILFTPYGDYCTTGDLTDNNPDSHKSGWFPSHLEGWAFIVFPQFHPTLGEGGLGCFYAWNCSNIEQDFERVCNELKGRL